MAKKGKRPPVNPEKFCGQPTVGGGSCKAYRLKGKDHCRRHGPEHVENSRKGGLATAEKRREFLANMAEAKRILNLLSQDKQAEYMNLKIMQQEFGENDWKAINAFMANLMKLTAEADPTQTIIIERRITPPSEQD